MIVLNVTQLHEYQKRMVNSIVLHKKLALWMDMGLGKTITTLTAIQWLLSKGRIKGALVIAPKTIAEGVWAQEAKQWEHTSTLRISLIVGTEKQRLRALSEQADIYVLSRDNLAWFSSHQLDSGIDADMLVVDESTSLKDPGTQRWKALCRKGKRLNTLLDKFTRVLLLSGTPASESYLGLWAQIYLLDRGRRLGTSITGYKIQYMIPEMYANCVYPQYHKMRPGACAVIDAKLRDISVSLRAEDYLELPELISIKRYTLFNKSSKEYDLYKQMDTGYVCTVDGLDIIAQNGAAKYQKLMQISSGAVYDEQHTAHRLHTYKQELMKEIADTVTDNLLVLYQFEYEKEFLLSLGAEVIGSPEANKRWNEGKIKLAIGHPASMGYGLNLYKGGHTIVWYTMPLSLEQYLQATKRLHRQGQRYPVTMIHLMSHDTIDDRVYQLLQSKQEVLDGLMCAMSVKAGDCNAKQRAS